ncbi:MULTISPECIES: NUDIX domain-containing protein [Bacillaceae]|uniref:ADP-ribose pyrophosphatase YjhB (NUDIX family) n=1 Tax=Peribacillus huizhouensis TaxID=1501239 RepID=A0ABR6CPQ2_9BACI|nr:MULTISPECIES: NUDIX hydrolase [Bacillaceae]MBA9026919.1 ADP-ribose pyrophosphatase YjhB (NUDIX family) [Peribacillus huizhouensis]
MKERCRNVWLAVSGLVILKDGRWLVVKKKYGGLKGMWSLPAGFVKYDETVDKAIVREVLEETGIHTSVAGLIGVRSGVIRNEISDNMLIFRLTPLSFDIRAQEEELYEAKFEDPHLLMQEGNHSVLLDQLLSYKNESMQQMLDEMNPGNQFEYTSYKLFL